MSEADRIRILDVSADPPRVYVQPAEGGEGAAVEVDREFVAGLRQLLDEQPLGPADGSAYSCWILTGSEIEPVLKVPPRAPTHRCLRVSIELGGRQWLADVPCSRETHHAISLQRVLATLSPRALPWFSSSSGRRASPRVRDEARLGP